jgi:hypothetical protein
MESILRNRLADLDLYRQVCVASAGADHLDLQVGEVSDVALGDVEYLPVFPDAEEILLAKISHLQQQQQQQQQHEGVVAISGGSGSVSVSGSGGPVDRGGGAGTVLITPATSEMHTWLYQHDAGSTAFLHPLCVRCLQHQAQKRAASLATAAATFKHDQHQDAELAPAPSLPGEEAAWSGDRGGGDMDMRLPLVLSGSVLEVELLVVTPENRRRFPFVRHLPLECPFALVEVDLRRQVDDDVYKM